jgi:Ca-activated chloride channel family protein
MEFLNKDFLYILLIVPFLILFIVKNKKFRFNIFILISFIFLIIAFARPILNNGEIKVKTSNVNVIIGLDLSLSMFANDVYPTRFDFAKNKIKYLIENFKDSKIGIIGFSSRTFMISPLTEDTETLEYLINNLSLDTTNLKGTDILNSLEVTNDLMLKNKKKVLVLFTDGGDNKDYTQEIEYAKEHNIKVYIYGIGTKKGSPIKINGKTIKDKSGNIVIVNLNTKIKELSLQTNGAYLQYSNNDKDINMIIEDIKSKFKNDKKEEKIIKNNQELFYYPLFLSFITFFISIFNFNLRRKK